jgi:hypothetical protein
MGFYEVYNSMPMAPVGPGLEPLDFRDWAF